jgi:hypothetical protein
VGLAAITPPPKADKGGPGANRRPFALGNGGGNIVHENVVAADERLDKYLNPQPFDVSPEPIHVIQRIGTNFSLPSGCSMPCHFDTARMRSERQASPC